MSMGTSKFAAMAALQAATKPKTTTRAKPRHDLPATDELQAWAEALAEAKTQYDDAESAKRTAQTEIRRRVDADRRDRLMDGDYAGTVRLATVPPVDVQYQNRWSELDGSKAEVIQPIAKEHFDRLFETRMALVVKPAIANSPERLVELVERLQEAGVDLGLYFDVTKTIKPRESYDRDRYPLLGRERAEELEQVGVRQTVVVKVVK